MASELALVCELWDEFEIYLFLGEGGPLNSEKASVHSTVKILMWPYDLRMIVFHKIPPPPMLALGLVSLIKRTLLEKQKATFAIMILLALDATVTLINKSIL